MKKAGFIKILIGFMLFVSAQYFLHPVEYPNEGCRYLLVRAIVDYHEFELDRLNPEGLIDVSLYNGRYYSAKAIGAPFLGVPVYWVYKAVRHFWGEKPVDGIDERGRYLIRLLVSTLPFCFLGVALFSMALRMGAGEGEALATALLFGLGTIAFIHAMLFSGHITAAAFSFFAFYLMFSMSVKSGGGADGKSLTALLAGISAGIGALSDYTAMFTALVLAVYVCSLRIPVRSKISFFLGGCICVLVLFVYNAQCFGHPWSMSYQHISYSTFSQGVQSGLLGVSLPKPGVFFKILFSPARGLFFIMPFLIYSFLGLRRMWQLDKKREVLCLLAVFCGFVFINAGFYGWHGGWTFGPRYLTPMLPFIILPIAFAPIRSIWFFLLCILAIAQVVIVAITFPHCPEQIVNPIFEIIIPFMMYGYSATNLGSRFGLSFPWSLLPIVFLMIIWAVFAFRKAEGIKKTHEPISLKVSAAVLALFIVASLSLQTTQPESLRYCLRAQLLSHAREVGVLENADEIILEEGSYCEK